MADDDVLVIFREPTFVLKSPPAGSEDYLDLLEAQFNLRELCGAESMAIVFLSAYVSLECLVSENGGEPKSLCAMRPGKYGFRLGLNMKVFRRLSIAARTELLKMQLLLIPHGCYTTLANDLISRYGPEVFRYSLQIVLSQVINPAILAENGIIIPTPESWGLERGKTIEEYCSELYEDGNVSVPVKVPAAPVGVGRDVVEALKELQDRFGFTNMSGMALAEDRNIATANQEKTIDIIRDVDRALAVSGNSLKSQGFIPGGMLEIIEALDRAPEVRWRHYIRNIYSQHLSTDTLPTFKKLSRRAPLLRLRNGKWVQRYPGEKPAPKSIVMNVIDTSGSMGSEEIGSVRSELLSQLRHDVVSMVMQVDAAVAKPPELFTRSHKLNEWFGRGGTDFRPAFDLIAKLPPSRRPGLIVYFTDGYGTAPDAPFPVPTLWVLTPNGYSIDDFRDKVCKWGQCVKMESMRAKK